MDVLWAVCGCMKPFFNSCAELITPKKYVAKQSKILSAYAKIW